MHGFRDTEVLLQAGYDVIVIYPPGGTSHDFSWRILKERAWLPDSDPSNFLSAMRSFRITRFYCGYDVIVSPSPGALYTLFTTDSEKATTTSWFRSIVTFYRGCMVSEITRFYCKPNMTSSSVLSQGALHSHFFTQVLLTESERETPVS